MERGGKNISRNWIKLNTPLAHLNLTLSELRTHIILYSFHSTQNSLFITQSNVFLSSTLLIKQTLHHHHAYSIIPPSNHFQRHHSQRSTQPFPYKLTLNCNRTSSFHSPSPPLTAIKTLIFLLQSSSSLNHPSPTNLKPL